MSPVPYRLAGLVSLLFLALGHSAAAQTAPADSAAAPPATAAPADAPLAGDTPARAEPTQPADASAELTPEEMAEIEAALAQDALDVTAAAEARAAAASAGAPGVVQPASGPSLSSLMAAGLGLNSLDISFILDAALAGFTSREPLQAGAHDPSRNGFNFQQFELALGTAVDPYFRFDGNIVFSQFGVEVEEAYATTTSLPGNLQARAGQFLTRFGRINPTHPHSWAFADQPLPLGRIFGGEGNRGLGMEVSWLSPLPWYVELIGSFTDASGEATARSFLGGGGGGVVSPFDFQFTGALKQFFPLTDDLSLMWGLSAATGPNPTGYRNHTDVYGTDLYLRYRPATMASNTLVTLQAEAFYRRRQVPGDVLEDFNAYGQAVWQFTQRWAVAGRYELGTPARNRSGFPALDPLDPEWTALRQRVAANLTFWPTEFSRLRLQGAMDLVGWRPQPDLSVFLALEVVIGAHGAHAF